MKSILLVLATLLFSMSCMAEISVRMDDKRVNVKGVYTEYSQDSGALEIIIKLNEGQIRLNSYQGITTYADAKTLMSDIASSYTYVVLTIEEGSGEEYTVSNMKVVEMAFALN